MNLPVKNSNNPTKEKGKGGRKKETKKGNRLPQMRQRYYNLMGQESNEENLSSSASHQTIVTDKDLKGIQDRIKPGKMKKSEILPILNDIEALVERTEDLQVLGRLSTMISSQMEDDHRVAAAGVKSRITRKVDKIRQQKATQNMKDNIPESIQGIAMNITSGGKSTEMLIADINKEAQIRNESRPKPRMSSVAITVEQDKKQLLLQLVTTIKENPEKYKIRQPLMTIKQLTGLGLSESVAADTVITNLITGKRFALARKITKDFMHVNVNINRWQSAIEKAELADIVLKGIIEPRTPEDDDAYFAYMQSEIGRRNIKHTDIILAKAHNGRIITLADVWSDSIKRDSSRSY